MWVDLSRHLENVIFPETKKAVQTLLGLHHFFRNVSSSSGCTSFVVELLDCKAREDQFTPSRPLDGLHSSY